MLSFYYNNEKTTTPKRIFRSSNLIHLPFSPGSRVAVCGQKMYYFIARGLVFMIF